MRYAIIVWALLLTGCGADQAVKKADKFYAIGEYYDAATQYRKAYGQTPSKEKERRGRLSVKMADCYRRIMTDEEAKALLDAFHFPFKRN